ncbi:MAG: putative dsRNA-binding protein, partial [Bacteroidales bacterium]
ILSLLRITGVNAVHNHIGGNALEALIGAIYIDKGYDACLKFVNNKIITPYIDLDILAQSEENFKSRLLEWSQKYKINIEYILVDKHDNTNKYPTFTFEIRLEGVTCGEGSGQSKIEAQQVASLQAYRKISYEERLVNQIFAAKNADRNNKNAVSTQKVTLSEEA